VSVASFRKIGFCHPVHLVHPVLSLRGWLRFVIFLSVKLCVSSVGKEPNILKHNRTTCFAFRVRNSVKAHRNALAEVCLPRGGRRLRIGIGYVLRSFFFSVICTAAVIFFCGDCSFQSFWTAAKRLLAEKESRRIKMDVKIGNRFYQSTPEAHGALGH
jgi:hypothetical protein